MKKLVISLIFAVSLLALLNTDAAFARPPTQEGATTPLQLAFKKVISERRASGLPTPASETYKHDTISGPERQTAIASKVNRNIKITATTILRFDNPKQAGYEKWPALVIADNRPPGAKGFVKPEDYTQVYREVLKKKLPGIWDKYQLGYEPRTYTFEETIEITYPAEGSQPSPLKSAVVSTSTTNGQILMGFTYTGPKISYTLTQTWDVCFGSCISVEANAGFEVDWGLGLRLPIEVSLTAPVPMVAGSSYNLTSAVIGLDWSANDFVKAGVVPENGNEYVVRFVCNFWVQVKVDGDEILNWSIGPSFDKSTSFQTPFGPNPTFDFNQLLFLKLTPDDTGLKADVNTKVFGLFDLVGWVGMGLKLIPAVGSKDITAVWQADGGALGNGAIRYTSPGTPVSFGPVKIADPGTTNANARIRLTDFKYWFTVFKIEVKGYLAYSFSKPFEASGEGSDFDITTIDISNLNLTNDLYLGSHVQCTWDFKCQPAGPSIVEKTIDTIPPTTTSTLSGVVGTNSWYRSNVLVTLTATDNPNGSGVQKIEYGFNGTPWNPYTGPWNVYSGPFTISTEGHTYVVYRATDIAGNVEPNQTQLIKIDKTPPTISGAATTTPNANGWYSTNVVVSFSASDFQSGVASLTPMNYTFANEGAGQSVTGTAIDNAGNSATSTVGNINIDKTPPTINITTPQAKDYLQSASFNIAWSTSDSLSGMATSSAMLDTKPVANGQTIDLFFLSLGSHTVTVQAKDKADNTTSLSVTFKVTSDINSLIAVTKRTYDLGWINQPGVYNSLDSKLSAVKAAIERNQLEAAKNELDALLNELDAQKGKTINAQAYELLKADVLYLIEHLQ